MNGRAVGCLLGMFLVLHSASVAATAPKKESRDTIKSILGAKKKAPAKGKSSVPRAPRNSTAKSGKPASRATRTVPARGAPAKRPPAEVIVARTGPATYRSLGEALRKAPAGVKILVRAGVYTESLLVDRPVEVTTSPADVGSVVVEGVQGPALLLTKGEARIHGIAFRTGPARETAAAVHVTGGRLLLERCEVRGGKRAAVHLEGDEARLEVRDSQVSTAALSGLLVTRGGKAVVEDTLVTAGAGGGITISGGESSIRNTRISKCKGAGLVITAGSRAELELSELVENEGDGAKVSGGEVVFRRCILQTNRRSGVVLDEGAKGQLTDCTFVGNGESGLLCAGASVANVDRSSFRGQLKNGLEFENDAKGVVTACQIEKNHWHGVHSSLGAEPVIRDCSLLSNNGSGVMIRKGGKGLVEGGEIGGSGDWPGVSVWQEGVGTFLRCRIRGNRRDGVAVWENGKGRFEECEIEGNAWHGIVIKSGGDPVIRRSRVQKNGHHGLLATEKGRGTIEECQITGNGWKDIEVTGGAVPVVRAAATSR